MEWSTPTGEHPVDQTNLKGLLTRDRQDKAADEVVRAEWTGRAFGE